MLLVYVSYLKINQNNNINQYYSILINILVDAKIFFMVLIIHKNK